MLEMHSEQKKKKLIKKQNKIEMLEIYTGKKKHIKNKSKIVTIKYRNKRKQNRQLLIHNKIIYYAK